MSATWPTVYSAADRSSMGSPWVIRPAVRPSGVDGLAVLVAVDVDGQPAGLRLLGHRDPQRQHAGGVVGVDVVGVERLPEEQLAAEGALRALGDEHLDLVVFG